MISYPVNVETQRFVLWRVSTNEVIKRNATWPRADGQPIEGQDPDYVYLEQIEGLQPEYDPRYYTLVRTEGPDVADERYNINWSTQKRPVDEIVTAAENTERAEIDKHVRTEEFTKLMILGLGVLFRQVDQQALTAKEQVVRDRCISVAVKLWKNDANLRIKVNAIVTGQEPDLDEGWEPEV